MCQLVAVKPAAKVCRLLGSQKYSGHNLGRIVEKVERECSDVSRRSRNPSSSKECTRLGPVSSEHSRCRRREREVPRL